MDVLSAGTWLRQRIGELGKAELDQRSKVTLESVLYDPVIDKTAFDKRELLLREQDAINAEAKVLEKLEPGPDKETKSKARDNRRAAFKTETDKLLLDRRESAWLEAVKQWLRQSCLVLNGRVFRDLHPHVAYGWDEYGGTKEGPVDHYDALRFKVALTNDNKKQWLELLGGTGFGDKPMSVSIALPDVFEKGTTEIMPTAINPSANSPQWQKVGFRASTNWLTWLLLTAFVLLLLLFVYYAFETNLLREMGMDGFWHLSLGRCQMAFWFFIICGCYMFVWIIIGDYKTLTSQELMPIGISAATGLSARFIGGKPGDNATKFPGADLLTQEEKNLDKEDELNDRATAEQSRLADSKLAEADRQKARERAEEFKRRAEYYKTGWVPRLVRALRDLISEANDGNPDFYRFQMIGWTLTFGVIFFACSLLQAGHARVEQRPTPAHGH